MALPVACKFNRFKVGQIVLMDGVMGIVIDESHAPYIHRDQVIYGKYHVHFPCGVECVGGEVLELRGDGKVDPLPIHEGKMHHFDSLFESFFAGCERIYKEYMDKQFPDNFRDVFSYKINRKYIKVITSGSVHCFVDRTTGDVLKPASWSAPAKHARGNIFDDKNGLGSMYWTGPAYLRG